jgi:hypothetical protein
LPFGGAYLALGGDPNTVPLSMGAGHDAHDDDEDEDEDE